MPQPIRLILPSGRPHRRLLITELVGTLVGQGEQPEHEVDVGASPQKAQYGLIQADT